MIKAQFCLVPAAKIDFCFRLLRRPDKYVQREKEEENMKVPVVELKKISKSFSGNRVLNQIDLSVFPGEILCMVGENGSGKSTIIKIISGVYQADEGSISIGGKAVDKMSPIQSIQSGIQVIYQDFSVFPNLTVAENIALSTQILEKRTWVQWRQMRSMAEKSLSALGVDLDLDQEVGNLPVAQKQIVAIARAILQDARLIIMDEPTTALTQKEIDRLYQIITGLSAKGIAVIFVSHKLDEVFRVCQRIAVIRNGEKVIDEPVETFDKEKLVYYMTGTEIEESRFTCGRKAESKLRVDRLSLQECFREVSFDIAPGEILAITGQLGSGRTELAKALFGVLPATSGDIYVDQEKVQIQCIHDALRYKIAYLPEDRLSEGLFMSRPVKDNIISTIVDKLVSGIGTLDEAGVDREASSWIKRLNVNTKSIEAYASTLSGGNQQRLVLGRWLAAEPEILILNCPTVGVDVKSKSEIHKIIKELAAQGLTVLLISDDIGEIMTTSNRVIVMNSGTMVFFGNTEETTHDELSRLITESA